MSFQFNPDSSSPPATPDRRQKNGKNIFAMSNPSTTPAGPPPSSAASFTPAGPPPSFLGTSVLGAPSSIKPLSFSKSPFQSNFGSSTLPESPSYTRTFAESEYQEAELRDFAGPGYDDEEHTDEDGEEMDEGEDAEGDEYNEDDQDDESNDEDMTDYRTDMPVLRGRNSEFGQTGNTSLILADPGAFRSSLGGLNGSMRARRPGYGKIAKDMCARTSAAKLDESDELILETEATVNRLYDEGIGATDDQYLPHVLSIIPGELIASWAAYNKRITVSNSEPYRTRIGPEPSASNFAKANFLSSLVLQIHHPKMIDPDGYVPDIKPLPQALLEWIDEHHNPLLYMFEEVQIHRPSPSNHIHFWNSIMNGLIRGKVVAVVHLLKSAGWRYAKGETDDIRAHLGPEGFTGLALTNVEKVTAAAVEVLSLCPAVRGDWNIRSSEWALFRAQVSQAADDLKNLAEGRDRERTDEFSTSAAPGSTFTRDAKKAQSKVPWAIYQRLLMLYGIVNGHPDTIILSASDWCEATIGLLVWWDEDKQDRLNLGRSKTQHQRALALSSEAELYQVKLQRAFELATETSEYTVDSTDLVEVGLASALEADNEAVISVLKSWSGPISSAVAVIASLGGWLPEAEPQNLITMDSLDDEVRETLGLDSSPRKLDGIKDQALIAYANSLAKTGTLKSQQMTREGWELAIAVLGRLDSAQRTEEMVGQFLEDLPLTSPSTVDKLWKLLSDLDMTRHAEKIAETYADQLAATTHCYGEALRYYALAHRSQKVKEVLNLLISYSLVQSVAYPPESELDDYLRNLLAHPQKTLTEMSRMDMEAAELVHKMISGYATLRKFFDIRDEDVLSPNGRKAQNLSKTKKKQAASALLAVIISSDDNIRGGLYDEERDAVVSVDFLIALLGEALVFINQPTFLLSAPQIEVLLRAIEDVQTVGPRVYAGCNEFLQTVIASGQGLKGSTPSDLLRKSTSNASGTSSFELVSHSMIASQLKQSMSASGVLVKGNVKRSWDWRHGITAGMKAEDVLRIMRLGLAKDLARAWMVEVDNQL